jgi:hypothetical protein
VLLLAVLLWLPVEPRRAIAAAVYLAPLLGGYLVTAAQYPPWPGLGGKCCPLVVATVIGALLAASAARAHHLSRL